MNKEIWSLINKVRSFGGSGEEVIDTLYRVLKMKSDGYESNKGEAYLYSSMMTKIKWTNLYKGDSRIFYETFLIIEGLSREEQFLLLTKAYEMKGRHNENLIVPEELFSVMSNKIEHSKSVFIPDCEKFGISLYELVISNPNIKFYTSSYSQSNRKLMQLLYKDTNIEFINHDYYKEDFVYKKFDQIIAFPIIGARGLEGDGQFISKDSALIAAQNLLYHLNSDGNLLIILPAKVTFGGGDSEHFRNYINENYAIKEIFSLPSKSFYPVMSINTYVFNFSIGRTEDILIRRYSFQRNKVLLKEEDEKLLFIDEFEALSDWSIDNVFMQDDDDMISYRDSTIKKIRLKEISTVFRGKSISSKNKSGNVSVINIKDITETGIDYEKLETISEEERKISRYLLEEQDVLVTSRGTNIKLAVFKSQDKLCIPSSNINVIRTDPKIISGSYVKLFLESSVGLKLLQNIQRGATIVNINYKDIEMLEIPMPSIEKQHELITKYETGLEIYKSKIEQAEEEWSIIMKEVQDNLF